MPQTFTITATEKLRTLTCCDCGVLFGMPSALEAERLRDKRTFYCVNGHPQSYVGESDKDKIARLQRERNAEADAAERLERQRDKAQKELKAVKARVGKGVCPCCNRSFVNVTRHMSTQHPNFSDA